MYLNLEKYYSEVHLDFTLEIKVLKMLVERCHTKIKKSSLKQHIKYFNFMSKIQLDFISGHHWSPFLWKVSDCS